METALITFGIVVGVIFVAILGIFALLKAFFTKVPQGTALIKSGLFLSKPQVTFTGTFVFPVIHIKELMRISLVTLVVDRKGKDGLICKDNLRADISVAFYLRVNETQDDVLKVAKSIGVNRASDHQAMSELFSAKFSEALKTVGKGFELEQLFKERRLFREEIKNIIGDDLNGYSLEDVAIDYLEQTPVSYLDPENIMDSEGIRKITELTANRNVETNRLKRDEELAKQKKNVEAKEASLALERQQATAEAQQKREIESTRAREEAETLQVQEQQRQKAEDARISAQEQIDVRLQNQQREVEIAEQNRQRAVVIEIEKVTRAKDLEVVARERDVELQRIDKEKALEVERKNIANVIRERVAVEKTVAQEEERIKEVRMVSEADRLKQVAIIEAEADAERELVRQVKKAQADEERSKHKAVEVNTMAQAELEAASKQAEAKIRMAEGTEAERAAPGLADAHVLEVSAAAKEKDGLAEAKIHAEMLIAEAKGEQEKGMAKVRILEAQAAAKEKDGLAEAKIHEEMLLAQAKGEQEKGLAQARILEAQAAAKEKDGLAEAKVQEEKLLAQARGEQQLGIAQAIATKEMGSAQATSAQELGIAQAVATKEMGSAQAQTLLERLNAEAEGLTKKFAAMDTLTDTSRTHEEFRLKLEKDFEEAMAAIAANKDIAKEQATVLSSGLANAKIEVISGSGSSDYYDKYTKALSIGKSLDGMMEKAPMVKDLLNRILGSNKEEKAEIQATTVEPKASSLEQKD